MLWIFSTVLRGSRARPPAGKGVTLSVMAHGNPDGFSMHSLGALVGDGKLGVKQLNRVKPIALGMICRIMDGYGWQLPGFA